VASGIKSIEETQKWMDLWVEWYNLKRAHSGWINRGLPPATVVEMWERTPGDVFAKMVSLGHIKPNEVHRTRLMGSGRHAVDLGLAHDTPYAFIIEAPPQQDRLPLPDGWTLPA
jgi:hypothetical protein